jgi:hypothetical protein
VQPCLGQYETRTSKVVPQGDQRGLVAVRGDIQALKSCLWHEVVGQDIRYALPGDLAQCWYRRRWRLYDERFATFVTGLRDFYHTV